MLRSLTAFCFVVLIGSLFAGDVFAEDTCVRLTSGVNPGSVSRGGTIRATAALRNCSAEDERFAVHYVLKGPCGATHLGTVYLVVEDDKSRTVSVSYQIPDDACTGNYAVTAKAYYDGDLIAKSSVALNVQ